MFVLGTISVSVMMVHVGDPAAFSKVGSNVLLALEGMLNMDADQRNDGNCLGQQNEPEEKGTRSP